MSAPFATDNDEQIAQAAKWIIDNFEYLERPLLRAVRQQFDLSVADSIFAVKTANLVIARYSRITPAELEEAESG